MVDAMWPYLWTHLPIVLIMPCCRHVVKYLLKFLKNGSPFILRCKSIFHVLKKTQNHGDNRNIFPFHNLVSNQSHGLVLLNVTTCLSFMALMKAIISRCSQFSCQGFIYCTSKLVEIKLQFFFPLYSSFDQFSMFISIFVMNQLLAIDVVYCVF